MTANTIITGVQILTTAAIILVPVLANHPINPLEKRADHALTRLRKRDDDVLKLEGLDEIFQDLFSDEEEIYGILQEEFELDIEDPEEINEIDDNELLDIEAGYLERGDYGFRVLLDAISQNRSISKSEVETVGLLFGSNEFLSMFPENEDMPSGGTVPIGPNGALFVDYKGEKISDRELITYYPDSPSLTLSLSELEIWLKESNRRKSHNLLIVLTLIWTSSSVLTII